MESSKISFFSQGISFELTDTPTTCIWLEQVAQTEGFSVDSIEIVFCNDRYLMKLNQEYLEHDTFTDILTFDQSDTTGQIEAVIYVSIERVKENAKTYQQNFESELNRIMVHGLLHLMGYNDKAEDEKAEMKKKEEAYLSLRNRIK